MNKLLERLSCLSGVSGCEDEVRKCILEQISTLADELWVDANGSVIALKKGKRAPSCKLLVCAHMDEVGLIITSVCEDGLLKCATVGGIDPRVLSGRTFLIGENRVPGVSCVVPIHLASAEERSKCPKEENLFIDIGADSREQALTLVSPGDVAVFDTLFEPMGDGLLRGKALDDRAGCAILIELMKQEYDHDVWFAFTTQEEVGLRGAGCVAYSVEPELAIVVEATTAADTGGVQPENQVCRVGAGAVLSFMDRRTIYDRELFSHALDIARDKGITAQVKQAVAGGNDSGAIQRSRGGVRTLAVSLPCRYLHSPAAVISELDMLSVYELVYELIAENK